MTQLDQPVAETRTSQRNSATWRVAAVVGLLAAGAIVGTVMSADSVVRAAFDRLVVENPVPPAVAVPKDGFAIIGASDDRFYIVTSDGTTQELRFSRRDLFWRGAR